MEQPIGRLLRDLRGGDGADPLGHHRPAGGDVGPGQKTAVPHAPGGHRRPQQPAQDRQAGQDPQPPIPGLHHMEMLGGHQHDHRHPQGPQLRGVGPHGGERQGALAEHPMGRLLLHQHDAGAGGRAELLALRAGLEPGVGGRVVGGDRVGGAGVGQQFRHGGGGGHRQQKTAAGLQGGQPIRHLQQEGHPHLQLGPFGAGHQGHPRAAGQGALGPGCLREVGHQVAHHPATGAPTGGEAIGRRWPHGGDAVVPAGPAGHPFGIGEVAVPQPG